jgi:large subunit ribosomal protein L1
LRYEQVTKRGKKYQEVSKLADKSKSYSPEEAIEAAKKATYAKFDETVELHLRMGVDPRSADQQVRGVILLPNGLGKKTRVLVFTQGEGVRLAQEAGADYAGAEELIKQIEDGWLEFDVSIATPDLMPKVAKLGRILGRRGLMPNPKSGTVVQPQDLGRVISEARVWIGQLLFTCPLARSVLTRTSSWRTWQRRWKPLSGPSPVGPKGNTSRACS